VRQAHLGLAATSCHHVLPQAAATQAAGTPPSCATLQSTSSSPPPPGATLATAWTVVLATVSVHSIATMPSGRNVYVDRVCHSIRLILVSCVPCTYSAVPTTCYLLSTTVYDYTEPYIYCYFSCTYYCCTFYPLPATCLLQSTIILKEFAFSTSATSHSGWQSCG
jgi:hypothetical protein